MTLVWWASDIADISQTLKTRDNCATTHGVCQEFGSS